MRGTQILLIKDEISKSLVTWQFLPDALGLFQLYSINNLLEPYIAVFIISLPTNRKWFAGRTSCIIAAEKLLTSEATWNHFLIIFFRARKKLCL